MKTVAHLKINTKSIYVSLSYFGSQLKMHRSKVLDLFCKYFQDSELNIVLFNKFLDHLCSLLLIDFQPHATPLIYNFRCSRCEYHYTGSTTSTYCARVAEYIGRRHRIYSSYSWCHRCRACKS